MKQSARRAASILSFFAVVVFAAFACMSCSTGRDLRGKPTTFDDASARLSQMEQAAAPFSSGVSNSVAWQNYNTAIRKARFYVRNYEYSENVGIDLSSELSNAEDALRLLKNGRQYPMQKGLRSEGYFADNDASFQPFNRYIPSSARKDKRMPLIVYLHGYSPQLNIVNWEVFPSNLVAFAESEGFALVAPFGRGNTDFQGIGEQDVLRVISEMRNRYPIDENRIILAGISMGGMGVWSIGAHYPDMFAGLLILAGRGDYYVWHSLSEDEVPPYKRQLIDTDFAAALVSNLSSIPIFCAHGEKDSLVSIQEARYMVKNVRILNPNVTYIEVAEGDHWIFEFMFGRQETRDWLKKCRRVVPMNFSYKTFNPRHNSCYWIRSIEASSPDVPAEVMVTNEGGKLVIEGIGVRSLAVSRKAMPQSIRNLPIVTKGSFKLLQKVPRQIKKLPGPARDAFLEPFMFVCAGDPQNESTMASFRRNVDDWYAYSQSYPRAKLESELSAEDRAKYNIFLFGEIETSPAIREVMKSCPIKITADSYVINDRKFPRKNTGLYVAWTSPWNPERTAVVQSGIPWAKTAPRNHKYDLLPGYIVYTTDSDPDGSSHALTAGFFK